MAFPFALVAIWVATTVAQILLRPKPRRVRGQEFSAPRTEEGSIIPVVFGVGELAPNIVWVGDVDQVDGENGQATYYARMIGVLCLGPIDELISIRFDDRDIRSYPKDRETDYVLSKALPRATWTAGDYIELFVDAQRIYGGAGMAEGGEVGLLHLHRGTVDDDGCPSLEHFFTADRASAFPGICYVVEGYRTPSGTGYEETYRQNPTTRGWRYIANNPTPKPHTYLVRRLPVGITSAAVRTRLANPMDAIYELATSTRFGARTPAALLDTAQMATVGATLAAEGLGICLTMGEPREGWDWIADLCEHIDAVPYIDPSTGKLGFTLVRDDYDVEDLPVFDASNSRDVVVDDTDSPELVNEVQVRFRELVGVENGAVVDEVLIPDGGLISYLKRYPLQGTNVTDLTLTQGVDELDEGADYILDVARGIVRFPLGSAAFSGSGAVLASYSAAPAWSGFREAIVRAQNLAAVTAAGEVHSVTFDLPYLAHRDVAGEAATRKLLALSRNLKRVRLLVNRQGWDLHAGSVIRVQRPDLGAALADVIVRVSEVDIGQLTDGWIPVQGIEDRFAGAPSIVIGDNTGGGDDDGSAPYAQCARPAALVALDPSQITWAIQSAEGTIVDYELQTATDSGFSVDLAEYEVDGSATDVGEWVEQEDPATPPEARYPRVRAVDPTGIRAPSEWLVAGPYTSTAGVVPSPVVVLPTVVVTRSETSTTGTVLLTITDPQVRVMGVFFRTKAGTAAEGDDAEDTAVPYTGDVALSADAPSTITWRVTYLDGDGLEAEFEATEVFGTLVAATGDPLWRRTQFI